MLSKSSTIKIINIKGGGSDKLLVCRSVDIMSLTKDSAVFAAETYPDVTYGSGLIAKSYPVLTGYDPEFDPNFEMYLLPKINDALDRLSSFDKKCEDECPISEIRYKFRPHSNEVTDRLSGFLLEKGCDMNEISMARYAMMVHDIGKVQLKTSDWHSEGKPSDKTKLERRTHALKGAEDIRSWANDIPNEHTVLHAYLSFIADVAQYHHAELEPNENCNKGILELPEIIQVIAVVEGHDGHMLERDLKLPRIRTADYILDVMTREKKQSHYHQGIVKEYCEHMTPYVNNWVAQQKQQQEQLQEIKHNSPSSPAGNLAGR